MAGELAADLRRVWKRYQSRVEYLDAQHRDERERELYEVERRLMADED